MINRDTLIDTYLDWRNNYLTVEKFAEHKGLHLAEAEMLIALAKSCFNNLHPES